MFFKKKEWVAPGWWDELNRKQRMYARRFADYLGRKSEKVPPARMRIYVMIFLLAIGAVDFGITMKSVRQHREQMMPVPFGLPEQLIIPMPRRPVARENFGPWLDSLRRDPAGGKALDSLLRARPGLADSLRQLEGMVR
jgi:hypothetical protein